MNAKIAAQALNFVAVSSTLTKKALDELTIHRTAQEKAASVSPELLQRLLQTGCVAQHQKQAAEVMLGSHAETMGLLKSAIDKIAALQTELQKKAAELGSGVEDTTGSTKVAGDYDSLNDPFVGRKTSKKKASDEAIMRVLQ